MRIAVLSDTHIPVTADDLPEAVYNGLKGADMILHAGDLVNLEILEKLSAIAVVRAVCGNMDNEKVCAKLPKKDIIKIGGVTLGLMHGWGPPAGLIELIAKEFKDVDAIIFGHSHQPLSRTENGILLFNPGSPTDKVLAPYNSYGILEINAGVITPSIIRI